MRHRLAGKELSRTSSHRKALRRNQAASLFEHGAIRTTETKAKELRPFVARLITLARKGTLHARRQVIALLQDRAIVNAEGEEETTVVRKLFDEIAPRYAQRPGGYTRVIRLAERRIGDAGRQVLFQLVEEKAPAAEEGTTATVSRRRRRARKRMEASEQEQGVGEASSAAQEPAETDEQKGEDAAPQPQEAEPAEPQEEEPKPKEGDSES